MRTKIDSVKTHIDQNRHHIRDLAIAATALYVGTAVIVKVFGNDSDAPTLPTI